MATATTHHLGAGRHFQFEGLDLERVIAHSGSDYIFTKRVRDTMGTGINFVDLTIVPAGSDIGVHTHQADNEEIYIVISGHGVMAVDGEEFPVGPGHVIINRPGGTHALRNTGDTELRMVVVEVPVPTR